jgi:tRNA U34 5-carboxymethylaminomethyl modifying GTPase MnmE/TrmE
MSKAVERELSKTIREKREQLITIRDEVEDLIDYLEVLEARAREQNKPQTTHAAEVMKHYRVK